MESVVRPVSVHMLWLEELLYLSWKALFPALVFTSLVASPNVGKCVFHCRYWSSKEQGLGVWERTWPYDMWSLGVVWLELILGTPHVFDISSRTKVCLSEASGQTFFSITLVKFI